MVLICVDPPDSRACCEALVKALEGKNDVAIISVQAGVRNQAATSCLERDGLLILQGAVGMSISQSPPEECLRSSGLGGLVVERLSKKQAKSGVKFINLLRSGGIPVVHCRNVGSYTHGAIIFETYQAAAALNGLSLCLFLRDRCCRLLWAAMIREGIEVLRRAARGGDWRAANPCCVLTLPQLELILCLPTPIFYLFRRLFLRVPVDLVPVMQMDLEQGRKTSVSWTLGELVRIADVHNVPASACRTVLAAMERAAERTDGIPGISARVLLTQAFSKDYVSLSTQELYRKARGL